MRRKYLIVVPNKFKIGKTFFKILHCMSGLYVLRCRFYYFVDFICHGNYVSIKVKVLVFYSEVTAPIFLCHVFKLFFYLTYRSCLRKMIDKKCLSPYWCILRNLKVSNLTVNMGKKTPRVMKTHSVPPSQAHAISSDSLSCQDDLPETSQKSKKSSKSQQADPLQTRYFYFYVLAYEV